MAPNWSLLLPGLVVGIATAFAIGGVIDVGRRLAERRARGRRFDLEAPGALQAAHGAIVTGIPRDPSSLVPAEPFVRLIADQVALLRVGSARARASIPAIAMLEGMDRLLEEMTVRGRALDTDLMAAFTPHRTDAEMRFMLKLTRQAIQRDPLPAGANVPEIESDLVNAVLAEDPELCGRIVRYRFLQERLFAVAEAFSEHWWTVRALRLDAAARAATARLTGGRLQRWRTTRAIEKEVDARIVRDFLPRWAELTPRFEPDSAPVPAPAPVKAPPVAPTTAKSSRTRL